VRFIIGCSQTGVSSEILPIDFTYNDDEKGQSRLRTMTWTFPAFMSLTKNKNNNHIEAGCIWGFIPALKTSLFAAILCGHSCDETGNRIEKIFGCCLVCDSSLNTLSPLCISLSPPLPL